MRMSEGRRLCLISNKRPCEASEKKDRVFIISSGSSEFQEDLKSVIEILDGFGLEGYFALLNEDSKGLDAFCDKICSQIKGSRFCVAILNDPIVTRQVEGTIDKVVNVRAPSANVYYELGMAVAFGKDIIPTIRKAAKLPFDLQHIDAVIYEDTIDLKKKMKKPILTIISRRSREIGVNNPEIVKNVYGPLYNEIDSFISRKDKYAIFTFSQYSSILTNYKYLLDKIDESLHKEITSFYDYVKEFNDLLSGSAKIIQEIVAEQLSLYLNIPADKVSNILTILVHIKTDRNEFEPRIDQLLIRNTTSARHYLETVGYPDKFEYVAYKLQNLDSVTSCINVNLGKHLVKKFRDEVEADPSIKRVRFLRKDLESCSRKLREKLQSFC